MRCWVMTIGLILLASCGDLGADGSAPRLEPVDNQWVVVGEQLSFYVKATDPDGDDLTFKISGRPTGAQFVALDDGETALFTWIPEVTDADAGGRAYELEFFVIDDAGLWDSAKCTVTVMPQGAAFFLNPPGYVLDLAESNVMEFVVAVKDDSAAQVDIGLVEGPEGVKLEQSGSKEAFFSWRPDKEQIAGKLFWYVRFSARGYASKGGRQEQLYEIFHDVAIVITNAGYAGCPGNPPVIIHEPLPDQHPAGSGGYSVGAKIQESDSSVAKALVRWTTGNPAEEDSFKSLSMTSDDGVHFEGKMPAQNAGAGLHIYYYIEATDDDDGTGISCDHQARFPKDGYLTFVAYGDGYDNACLEDSYEDNDSFEQVYFLFETGSFPGLRICGSDVDYLGFTTGAGAVNVAVQAFGNGSDLRIEPLDNMGNPILGTMAGSASFTVSADKMISEILILRFSSESGNPVLFDLTVGTDDEACEPDSHEPNNAFTQAKMVGEGQHTGLTICAGDEDYFRVDIPANHHITAVVDHLASQGDLDLFLLGGDGQAVLASAETGSNLETLSFDAFTPETFYLRISGYKGAANQYNLVIDLEGQGEYCPEDNLAPNQYVDEAIMVPPNEITNLMACPGKQDWFQLGLNGGETVTVKVYGEGGMLGLTFFSPDGVSPLCTGTTGGTSTSLQCFAAVPGNYPFQVANNGLNAVPYMVEVTISEDLSVCKDDRFEANDSPGEAAPLEYSVTTWLKACGTNEDWFSLVGFPLERVNVYLLYEMDLGVVDATLFDESGDIPLAWSDSSAGSPGLVADLPEQGTYTIRIRSVSPGATIPYNLIVWFE